MFNFISFWNICDDISCSFILFVSMNGTASAARITHVRTNPVISHFWVGNIQLSEPDWSYDNKSISFVIISITDATLKIYFLTIKVNFLLNLH